MAVVATAADEFSANVTLSYEFNVPGKPSTNGEGCVVLVFLFSSEAITQQQQQQRVVHAHWLALRCRTPENRKRTNVINNPCVFCCHLLDFSHW